MSNRVKLSSLHGLKCIPKQAEKLKSREMNDECVGDVKYVIDSERLRDFVDQVTFVTEKCVSVKRDSILLS